jgi:predicted nucleic acid-binding protein
LTVIDASVVLAWLFAEAQGEEADSVLRAAAGEGIVVPALFWLEVANALRTRLRRGVLRAADRDQALARVRALGALTAEMTEPDAEGLDRTINLSDRYDLTVYDAAYLELALRLGEPLRTFDTALNRAALAVGVID